MVILYKQVKEKEDIGITEFVVPTQSSSSKNVEKLYNKKQKFVRKIVFVDRAIQEQNVLSRVYSAKNVHSFKQKYDKSKIIMDTMNVTQSC